MGSGLSPEMILKRVSPAAVPIRPAREFVLHVELIKALPDPGPLPDLAVHNLENVGNKVSADILNIGAGGAEAVVVRMENAAGKILGEKQIDKLKSARDFTPGKARITFILPKGITGTVRIVADAEDKIEEVIEENNAAGIRVNS